MNVASPVIAGGALSRARQTTESALRQVAVLESTLESLRGATSEASHAALEQSTVRRGAELRERLQALVETASAAAHSNAGPQAKGAALAALDAYSGAVQTTDAVLRGTLPARGLEQVVQDVRRGHALLSGGRPPVGALRGEHVLRAEERSAVHSAELARALRRGQPGALDEVEHVLRTGSALPGAHGVIPANGNANGALSVETLLVPDGVDAQRAVLKPAEAQAAQEEFGWRLLRQLGVDYLAPATARRADGSAAITLVEGDPFWKQGVRDQGQLDRVLTDGWQSKFPNLTRQEAGRAAVVDRELVQFVDWLTANPDRHAANGIIEAGSGSVRMIDHGFIGRGESTDPLRPRMKATLLPPGGRIVLNDETRRHIARSLTSWDLRQLHRTLGEPAGTLSAGAAARLAQDASEESLARMQQRLRHAVENGVLEYEAIPDSAHPLHPDQHPAW
jgi:hypothetical protein